MAKSLPVNSVANEFADYNSVVILDNIGGKNTETETATTYTVFVPEKCMPHLPELRMWINNNWDAKVFKHPDGRSFTAEEKLAAIPTIAETFEPKEPKAQTPLRRAVQNILCRMHPQAVQGLSGSALVKALEKEVERFIHSASLEKYRSQIEAELIAIKNETGKRARRGEGETGTQSGPMFDFDTADAATQEAAE